MTLQEKRARLSQTNLLARNTLGTYRPGCPHINLGTNPPTTITLEKPDASGRIGKPRSRVKCKVKCLVKNDEEKMVTVKENSKEEMRATTSDNLFCFCPGPNQGFGNLDCKAQELTKYDVIYGQVGPTYGLELVLTVHSPVIKTATDVLVVWLHWCFIRNGFDAHGGEFTHVDYSSENLPRNLGWNGDKRAYILKYLRERTPYVLGVYLRDDENVVEISLVTLHQSMRLSMSISDLVNPDDFQIDAQGSDNLAKVIDEEMIRPTLVPRCVCDLPACSGLCNEDFCQRCCQCCPDTCRC